MKTTPLFLVATVLLAAGCNTTNVTPASVTVDNVTVNFQESDKFTDVREDFGSGTSQHYLDQLRAHLQKTAGAVLAEGQKLSVTFTDIDLAGDFRPTSAALQNVRIIKDIDMPRMTLFFKLIGPDDRVIKDGERRLNDMNFMSNLSIIDRDQPLFYDKALLSDWVRNEFPK